MKSAFPMMTLGRLLVPVSRPEIVDPTKTYSILGAHWYATGLYTKDLLPGSAIQAKQLYRVEQNDFVYNRLFGWKGSFAVATKENHGCYVSNEFPCFIVKADIADCRYIWRYFSQPTVWDEVLSLSIGGTPTSRNRLKEEQLLHMEIPLPSIDEQRRIVERVEHVAIRLSEAQTLRKQASQETDALVGREIAEVFARGKQAGWNEKPLGDYVVDALYGTSEKTTDDQSGIPIIRMGNIQNGHLKLGDLKYLQLSGKDRARLVLKKGDVLVNRTNSAELVGKCAVFDLDREFAFASYIIRLRFDTSRAEPALIARYINSPAGRAYMFNERKQMTGQANVNATKLKALPIAIPALAEQRNILAHLHGLEQKINLLRMSQEEIATQLDALMPSTLDKAFRGEL
jgi:type I restriction enzyme, S subunit